MSLFSNLTRGPRPSEQTVSTEDTTNERKVKACVDCRFCFPKTGWGITKDEAVYFAKCGVNAMYCSSNRRSGECGPKGRWFEKK